MNIFVKIRKIIFLTLLVNMSIFFLCLDGKKCRSMDFPLKKLEKYKIQSSVKPYRE